MTLPFPSISTRCKLKEGRTARKAGDLSTLSKGFDHGRQIHIGEAVAVVGKKHLLALKVRTHSKQTLSDVAPHSRVDHCDTPVPLRIVQGLNAVAAAGDDAVCVDLRPVVEEELLDDVGLVAEAQDEVLVSVLAVVMHQMPENWLVADGDHRLRDVLRGNRGCVCRDLHRTARFSFQGSSTCVLNSRLNQTKACIALTPFLLNARKVILMQ